jgi:hypothetical protein
MNLFSTHLGRTFGGKAHWTEIGIVGFANDPVYHLYTCTRNQLGEVGWAFFVMAQIGDVFEFVIRLNESDTGPYGYETLCSGTRVRRRRGTQLAHAPASRASQSVHGRLPARWSTRRSGCSGPFGCGDLATRALARCSIRFLIFDEEGSTQ